MAHEFESGFFTRVPAWHKLGTVVQDAPSVADAIQLAGLDWPVEERKLWIGSVTDRFDPIESHKAIIRSTDSAILGVVGSGYQILQNTRAFSFFEPFVASKLVTLDAAGSLKNGRRVWVLAKIAGAAADVVKGDSIAGYLLLSNAHDGSQAVRVQFTTIRVVCWNTLSRADGAAAGGTDRFLSVKHTGRLDVGLDAIQKSVDIARRTFDVTVESYRHLADAGCSYDELRKYVRTVFNYEQRPDEEMPNAWEHIATVFERGPGMNLPGNKGSWWSAINAVTDFIDHGVGRGRGDESRLHSSWFGSGSVRRDVALKTAMSMAFPSAPIQ